jgi:uncharacterized protein YggE
VKALIAGAAFALAALAATLPATAEGINDLPTLVSNGEGFAYVTPDIAIVSIGVTTRGATAAEALTANSADLAKVIESIRGEGVEEKDIGTSGFNIFPVYEEPKDGQPQATAPKILGYNFTNEVRVTIRDIAKSGGILDKVVSAGANQVNGITFDNADRTTSQDAAIEAAIGDARRKADVMARAAGVKLVRIINVQASSGGTPMPMFARANMDMAAAMPVPVMPGQQQVNGNATVTWEIAPQ